MCNVYVFTESSSKAIAGSNSAAEASKILAENRRLAREQKEKEEQLRIQKEEEEKFVYLISFSVVFQRQEPALTLYYAHDSALTSSEYTSQIIYKMYYDLKPTITQKNQNKNTGIN